VTKVALDRARVEGRYPAERGPTKTRLLTRDSLDGRTRARKQFDAIANGITSDLGGRDALSTVELALVEAFAGASIHVHDLNARLLLGQKIDLSEHAAAISSLVRIASRIGTRRRPRDVTPTVDQYIRSLEDDPP
jgi:hypothetical protein